MVIKLTGEKMTEENETTETSTEEEFVAESTKESNPEKVEAKVGSNVENL